MKTLLNVISWLALLGTALAPVLFFAEVFTESQMKLVLVLSMVAWFGSAIARQQQAAD